MKTISFNVSSIGGILYHIALQLCISEDAGFFSARITKIWLE